MKLGNSKQKPLENKSLPAEKEKFKTIKEKNRSTHIMFSFESIDLSHEYFNLDGTCINWTLTMMESLRDISNKDRNEIVSRSVGKIRFHNHESNKAQFKPPYNLDDSEFYQIRFGKSKGGIHGVLVENIFYVIWLDPQHNMYPIDKYGGLKKIIPPSTCCKDRDSELIYLKDEVNKLIQENEVYQELIDEIAATKNN
ncbi:hypothetical protein [Lachnoclostridium sp.]|uniref:hypothetical protein n=1 Tax=Lachnoclostridium sp. TaxID=2028282 RepID=UPI0028A2D5F5|nr:hypothetical protein [Lachnoclostridium sp.]